MGRGWLSWGPGPGPGCVRASGPQAAGAPGPESGCRWRRAPRGPVWESHVILGPPRAPTAGRTTRAPGLSLRRVLGQHPGGLRSGAPGGTGRGERAPAHTRVRGAAVGGAGATRVHGAGWGAGLAPPTAREGSARLGGSAVRKSPSENVFIASSWQLSVRGCQGPGWGRGRSPRIL